MAHVFQIAVLSCAVLVLTGCNGREESNASLQGIKVGDLAPSLAGKRAADQLSKTVNFAVHVFEIPAENISTLDDVWAMLSTKPLRFSDYDAFGGNLFSAGLGRVQMWDKISALLTASGARRVKVITLLLSIGQTDDFTITRLHNKQNISYVSSVGLTDDITVGPGTLVLRIKTEKIPGSRGVCKVNAVPVLLSPMRSSVPQSATRIKSKDLVFGSCGFKVKMRPGNFFFLGPTKYADQQATLGGLFFSQPGLRPSVKTFLFVCTGVNN